MQIDRDRKRAQEPGMQAEDRARAIVERVRGEGFQAIEALALQFGVTPQTIRRDVNHLCDRGLLRRRHGGVELPPDLVDIDRLTPFGTVFRYDEVLPQGGRDHSRWLGWIQGPRAFVEATIG